MLWYSGMRRVLILLVGAAAVAVASEEEERRVPWGESYLRVRTGSGEVQGFLEESCRDGKKFAGFRGIPYAEPPLGALRFRDPVPVGNWDGVWDATFQRSSCVQDKEGDEDCLYLNVYTPNLMYLRFGLAPLKPVMVFIHPGAFNSGSSSESVFSPDFLIGHDVVIVTLNYRLGAFGFLSLQNEDVPGNAGLKDQTLALKWIKRNIRSFGGDPEKITIFGESAGAASVNYHIIAKPSAGLFKRAIMQSGSVLAPWAFSPPDLSLKKAFNLAKKVKCGQKDRQQLLKCLQEVPAELLLKHQGKALTLEELFSLRIIAFQPTIEPDHPNAFLTDHPYDLLTSGNFTKVPAIVGLTSEEGLLVYPTLLRHDPQGFLLTLLGMDLSRFAPYNFHLKPFTKAAIMAHREISKFYFNSKTLTKAQMNNALELLTDVMFTLPIQLTASLLADEFVPVYNYLFTYDGGYNVFKAAANISQVPGVCHGDDLGYLFYTPRLHTQCKPNASMSLDDVTVSRMTKMWTDFAKTGNPTPARSSEIPKPWKPFTQTERNYLDIGTDLVPSDGIKLGSMIFWENLIKTLIDMTLKPGTGKEAIDDLELPENLTWFP